MKPGKPSKRRGPYKRTTTGHQTNQPPAKHIVFEDLRGLNDMLGDLAEQEVLDEEINDNTSER
jgi:hypothetical protein